eukprot:Gb_29455 [translate_table: standard]
MTMETMKKYSHQAYGKHKERELDLKNEIQKNASPRKAGSGSQGGEDRNFVSTKGSPQGTNHRNIWQAPDPARRGNRDSLVFNVSTNTIKKLKSRLTESDSRKPSPRNGSPITFPTGSKSYDELLEYIIKDIPKTNSSKKEDQPLCCLTKENIPMDKIEMASKTSNSSEIIHKAKEPVSLQNNPLYKRRRMTSNEHPENYKPQQLMGNLNQTNNKEELMHKPKTNHVNPFANCGPIVEHNFINNNRGPRSNASLANQ